MIRVKTFSSQLKIFHTRNELLELDQVVNEYVTSRGIRKVISVSDAVTTGTGGEAIGVIRVIAYEDPGEGAKEKAFAKMEERLRTWGDEVEKLRVRADRLGTEARTKFQVQSADLRAKQEAARRRLQELRQAGGEKWEDVREAAESALDDLKKAVENVLRKGKR